MTLQVKLRTLVFLYTLPIVSFFLGLYAAKVTYSIKGGNIVDINRDGLKDAIIYHDKIRNEPFGHLYECFVLLGDKKGQLSLLDSDSLGSVEASIDSLLSVFDNEKEYIRSK